MFKDHHHTHRSHHFAGFAGRHGGRGGGGRHGWGRGSGFWGPGGGMPGARKLSSSDLQLVILALLEQAPAHGYELIKALETRSEGFYVPSPGMIYPALTYLDEVGHAEAEAEGVRKLYRITEAGRAHLEAERATADAMLDMLSRIGSRMEQVREAFAGVDDIDPRGADELHRARHALRHALMRTRGAGPQEAARIAGILASAAAEILNLDARREGPKEN